MRILLLSMVMLAACAGATFADDDQDRAYRALRRGEIMPLEQVLAAIRRSHAGTILEIELERRHGRWVYEVETLSEDGVIAKTYLDAATMSPLSRERGEGHGKEDRGFIPVLLVEDEPGIARHVAQALAAAGYAVDHAADGEEAQFLGETGPYDVAILDLGLPGQDGLSGWWSGWSASRRRRPHRSASPSACRRPRSTPSSPASTNFWP